MSKWIPVDEALPGRDKLVLVTLHNDDRPALAVYNSQRKKWLVQPFLEVWSKTESLVSPWKETDND